MGHLLITDVIRHESCLQQTSVLALIQAQFILFQLNQTHAFTHSRNPHSFSLLCKSKHTYNAVRWLTNNLHKKYRLGRNLTMKILLDDFSPSQSQLTFSYSLPFLQLSCPHLLIQNLLDCHALPHHHHPPQHHPSEQIHFLCANTAPIVCRQLYIQESLAAKTNQTFQSKLRAFSSGGNL